ncbi:MAG TPA: phosphoglucosamine mutase, partial [Bacillota bacterium]
LEVGRVTRRAEAVADYSAYLAQTIGERLDGLTVAVDCGFGATYQVAPQVLKSLGARVIPINNQNDGSRINVGCGSTNPQELQRVVTAEGAQVGLAHDGDGDRVIAVDERGELVDGDEIMAICGLRMLAEGRLPGKAIAATVYSNLGLREAFQKYGGEVIVTENGDRKVLEAMRERGLVLGGEQSGHIIFLEHNTTGDGILSALQLLSTMVHSGQPLSVLKKEMRKFPQLLENVRVARKTGWEENREIRRVIEAARENLGDNGRIFVRASGTEPLIRIMAEGPDREMLVRLINDIAGVIRKELS